MAAAPGADGKIASGSPDVPDAYTKFPAVRTGNLATPGKGGKLTTLQVSYTPPPTAHDGNRYWQELEKRLGVKWEPTFVPAASYNEKFAAQIAGGDLPEIVSLGFGIPGGAGAGVSTVLQAINQGVFTDLTPYLDGDNLKEYPNLAAFSSRLWKNARLKDKIMRVPSPSQLVNNSLIYRPDWAAKVGVPQVRNADDFYRMAVGMSKMDPDGNGSADTFGFGSNSNGDFNLTGIRCMFRIPQDWKLNPDGTLTYYIETPEFKEAITFARRLYEGGAYHPDAATMDLQKSKDLFIAGKLGGFYDNTNNSRGDNRLKLRAVNPMAESAAFIPPGYDGGKGSAVNGPGYAYSYAIPVKVGKDKERVKELLRILDYMAAPVGTEEWQFIRYGIEGAHYTRRDGAPVKTELWDQERGDFNNLMGVPPTYVDTPLTAGDAVFLQQVQRDLVPLGVDDPVAAVNSPTRVKSGPQLDQFNIDRRIALIAGREPLSALDGWIRDWRSRGGDTVRKELEQGLKEV